MMHEEYSELSEEALETIIKKAEKVLQAKKEKHRKEVMAQIKELAASIDATVEIMEESKSSVRKGVKLPIKYRNPKNSSEKWTGRGMQPKWLRNLIDAGHKLEEFEV